MTALGWIFMFASWGLILALCAVCFYKVMTTRKDNIHAPLDIDTEQTDQTD